MELVFWQNILSPHQSAFIRALAEMGHLVTGAASRTMDQERTAMGWQVPWLKPARVVLNPGASGVRELVNSGAAGSIHIVAGARWTPLGNHATRCCFASRKNVGILSEAP